MFQTGSENRIKSHDWQVDFLFSPSIAQITLKSAKLSLLLKGGVTAFMLYEMRHSVTMYIRLPKIIWTFKNKLSHFIYPFRIYFIYLLYVFHKFLEPNCCITFDMDSIGCACFIMHFRLPKIIWTFKNKLSHFLYPFRIYFIQGYS